MGVEIERKFLVAPERLGELGRGQDIRQGYIATADRTAVRVRLSGDSAWLTIKGESVGARRTEFEYSIPAGDARQILAELCGDLVVEKTRYRRQFSGYEWDIDVFRGANDGLIVAEVELQSETESPELPDWVAGEVTGDPRYYNADLAAFPYCRWRDGAARD